MSLHNAEQAEAELERLRIELAILRAAKMRNDLTNLVNNNPLESLSLNEIGRIDDGLHDLEVDARSLVHELPLRSDTTAIQETSPEPFLLRDPLPDSTTYTIERVANKFWNRSQDPQAQ